MPMLQVTNTREQKAAVVISTPHYAPSLPSLRHRYTIYPQRISPSLSPYSHIPPPARNKRPNLHSRKIQYLNSSHLAISRTHIGGHARTRRASTPSSDPRLQPPPYPIYSSVSCHRLTYHSFGVGTARFVHQLSFDSVPSHKTPKQRLCCIHSPATSESSETAMATVVRDGLRLKSSIFPAGELVRGGSLSSVVVVCIMRG
ncbi:hypothetical protein BKA58DRAFT_221586 [Alternaria rosae]|uniref:uncharacterized protein n=1 Tax=Alternaria rosae TaxID=1187941 RepID=UPI001E8D577B|nr:uncharacterized protein BKA58DRAFT_221586 [Alternaria rosae]KAH6865462.1 hypothetical protein BKA58DRAFT_221586 [Alternaria rosae]